MQAPTWLRELLDAVAGAALLWTGIIAVVFGVSGVIYSLDWLSTSELPNFVVAPIAWIIMIFMPLIVNFGIPVFVGFLFIGIGAVVMQVAKGLWKSGG